MPGIYTDRLNIRKVQPTDYFISDTFNAILDDIDSKVLGLDHLETALHWTEWEEGTAYEANDVVRWRGMKSHQYAKCLVGGVSGSIEPGNNVTGSVLTDGTVRWKVMSLTENTDTTGSIVLWLGGVQYSRGDIVLYADALYRARIDHTASSTFEADDGYWQEIYASVRKWLRQKYYYLDDTIIVGNTIYRCILAHTSANTFDDPAETPCWSVVGNLARVLEWSGNTQYFAGQVITKNGLMYRSLLDHVSDVDFSVDASNWELVYASIIPWTPNAWYESGAVVYYNNILYRCTTSHTSTAVFNPTNWAMLHDPTAFVRSWVSGQHYYQNQLVYHNNNIYKCNVENSDTAFDIGKWILITDSINDWASSIDYVVGQYVYYDGALYKCITANNDVTFTNIKWQKISGGGLATWISNKEYIVGDVVINAGKIYQCNTAHTSSSSFNTDTNNWTEISACITRIPNWAVSTDYVVGDLVAHDAKIYRCITAHTSDATQWDNAEEANWEELSPTINEISSWAVSTDYEIGQLVIHDNKLYRCNTAHTSDSTSFNTDIAYWDAIGSTGIDIWRANEAYTTSNVVIYNNKIYKCNTAHTSGSTFDPTMWDEISSADIGLWQPSTDYKVGNVVIKDNQIYRCKTLHTSDSSDFYTDIANWDILDTKWQAKDWATNTYYLENEVVLYDNTPYKCMIAHTSLGTFELDKANWEPLDANIRQWVSGTTYKVGDTVLFENELWECITANNDLSFRKDKWRQISKCNIEVWCGAPDINILALLHMDNGNDLGHNEYGDDFAISNNPAMSSGRFGLGINLASRRGRVSSPQYDFNNGETYTIEFWMLASDAGFTENAHVVIGNIGEVITFRMYQGLRIFYDTPYAFIPTNFIGGAWNHMAFVISPTECTTFINGNLESTSTRLDSSPIYLTIGDMYNQLDYGSFGIDELLITRREKYTVDFDVPTEPFQDPNYEGYKKDDLVVYNDKIYRALEDNNDVEFTPSKWVEVSKSEIPYWTSGSSYSNNEVVLYGKSLYRAITNIVNSTVNPAQSSDFQLLDTTVINEYAGGETYQQYEAVRYNDDLYVANSIILNSPSTFDATQWTRIGGSGEKIKTWTSGEDYSSGDIVIYNGELYTVINNISGAVTTPDSSSDYQKIGGESIKPWQVSTDYFVGNIVVKDNQLYRCSIPHTSDTTSFILDIANWQPLDINWLVKGWEANKLYLEDQAVYYNDSLWKCLATHESNTDDSPADAVLYESSTNVIDVDNTTIIPYSETIDLGSVKKVTDFTYNEVTTDMSFTYTIETSEDNITFTPWAGTKTNARYVKLTVDTVNIVTGATAPNAYLDNFTVIGESDNWEKISSGGTDIEYATDTDIDGLFD